MFPEKTRFGRDTKNMKIIHIPLLPAPRLDDADYQQVTELLQTTGDSFTTHSARFYTFMATINVFNG